MMTWRDRFKYGLPRLAVIVHDLAMVWVCWQGLHYIRYALQPTPLPLEPFSSTVLIVMVAQGLVSWQVGLYRGLWRFASVPDLLNIFKASVLGLLAVVAGLFFYSRLDLVSRAALLLYPFVLTMLLGAPRLIFRAWKDQRLLRSDESAERVLILGAGQAGEALVRDLRRIGRYQPIGFLDDAAALRGTRLQGLPILGRVNDVGRIARETGAQLLVIAMPSLDATAMRRVVGTCEESGVPFRTVPRLADLLEGRSLPGQLKEVAIEDLLGRQPLNPDWKAIRGWLGARSVLVTGAGGSIGAELCRQILALRPRQLVLFERSEYALYAIEQELGAMAANMGQPPPVTLIPLLGSVVHRRRLQVVMERFAVQTVYHAAAYKHVPIVEHNPIEGVRNNVFGTRYAAEAALAAGVETFVLISSDKAVRPTNVMGATKRLAELILQGLAGESSPTRLCMVRFGNVLDSSGSVVPLFREQIRKGGPVTVTHPEVERYFMTIPEAAQLVIQASAMAQGGDLFLLDMGDPVRILDLARRLIRLSGLTVRDADHPEGDVEISFTGLRSGEKLREELLIGADDRPTAHPMIRRAREDHPPWLEIRALLDRLDGAAHEFDYPAVRAMLQEAVAEYQPENGIEDWVWRTEEG